MPAQSIEKLTLRERDCLRLVARGYTTKEIAREIGVTDLRAQKIIESANRKLGVSRRMEAARLLAAHENRGVDVTPGGTATLPPCPAMEPSLAPEDTAGRPMTLREERTPFGETHDPATFGRPLRQRGDTHNDLSTWQRAIWIAILCAIVFLGLGALARGLGSLSDQIIVVPSTGH